jgi:hypothetical protein
MEKEQYRNAFGVLSHLASGLPYTPDSLARLAAHWDGPEARAPSRPTGANKSRIVGASTVWE